VTVRIMSDKELSRLGVLRDLDHQRLTAAAAAEVLGLGRRQVLRLLKAYRLRAQMASGRALSIDDLANLNQETVMASKLTRSTLFHPALVPHQDKYFRPEEIDAIARREDFDQECDIALWPTLISELKTLAASGDPASPPAALDLGRRWRAQTDAFTRGDEKLAGKLRSMSRDALADPKTASQLPFSADDVVFLEKIIGNLNEAAG
jgi:hypothetical protein